MAEAAPVDKSAAPKKDKKDKKKEDDLVPVVSLRRVFRISNSRNASMLW